MTLKQSWRVTHGPRRGALTSGAYKSRCKIPHDGGAPVFSLDLHSDGAKPFLCVQTENTHTHTHLLCAGWDIPFCPHGWPALATGHRAVDSGSGLHGDEQDLGRYLAYWKHSLLLTFRNGEGGRALSAGSVGVGGWRRGLAPCWR